jgi:hypothetical protein
MTKTLWLLFVVSAGAFWVAALAACFFGVRFSLRRTIRSIRKALALCVFALIVGYSGARVFRFSYGETIEPYPSAGSATVANSSTHWHIDSEWFFHFVFAIAVVSFAIVVRMLHLDRSVFCCTSRARAGRGSSLTLGKS